jgi:hypothetical protein
MDLLFAVLKERACCMIADIISKPGKSKECDNPSHIKSKPGHRF